MFLIMKPNAVTLYLHTLNKREMALLEKDVIVKKSKLPGAGKGLFAKKFIPKGTRIVEYKGRIKTWKEVNPDKHENGYIYYVKRYHVIDAAKTFSALARYANDARGIARVKGITNNSEYIEEGLKVYIKSVKDIFPGEEILVAYGKEYWDAIRHNIRSEEKKSA
ncbi:MAG: SET domain-containing protein-lysine N-methyltransferase [Chitinophagaceae bacterium]